MVYDAYDAEGHVAADPDPQFGAGLQDAAWRAEHGEVLVAVDASGELLGTVTVVLPGSPLAEISRPGEVEVRMLATSPVARGRGVGTALVEAVLARARGLGAARVVLCTLPGMTAAHGLYERLGFRRAGDLDWEPVTDYPLIGFCRDL
ncbi:MAG: GNAT family N-acetyltransferase [Thermocrispum sp.]